MTTISKINNNLRESARIHLDSSKYTGSPRSFKFFKKDPPLFCDFKDLFELPSSMDEAFRIVTEGQGGESSKVNSLRSSSLLSLLCFGGLYFNSYKGESGATLIVEINGEDVIFDACLFEVRNQVIGFPSCIDILLRSKDKKKLLFLESKFTEYAECKYRRPDYKIKTGYLELYSENAISRMLEKNNMNWRASTIFSENGQPMYFEGIKQSISHLIGIVRGPQMSGSGHYPEEYHKLYSEWYKDADTLTYATILFDTSTFGGKQEFEEYRQLFENTVGQFSEQIIENIKRIWHNQSIDKEYKITVVKKPITYQSIFEREENRNILPQKVKDFYHL